LLSWIVLDSHQWVLYIAPLHGESLTGEDKFKAPFAMLTSPEKTLHGVSNFLLAGRAPSAEEPALRWPLAAGSFIIVRIVRLGFPVGEIAKLRKAK